MREAKASSKPGKVDGDAIEALICRACLNGKHGDCASTQPFVYGVGCDCLRSQHNIVFTYPPGRKDEVRNVDEAAATDLGVLDLKSEDWMGNERILKNHGSEIIARHMAPERERAKLREKKVQELVEAARHVHSQLHRGDKGEYLGDDACKSSGGCVLKRCIDHMIEVDDD